MTLADTANLIVCSAHAEVIPRRRIRLRRLHRLLRTRGGDPGSQWSNVSGAKSAPHTRR